MAFTKAMRVGQLVNLAIRGSEGLTQERLVEFVTSRLVPKVMNGQEVKPLVEGHLDTLRENGVLVEEVIFRIQH